MTMNLRPRSKTTSKNKPEEGRTVLGDVGNKIEQRGIQNIRKGTITKKNKKATYLDSDKSTESSENLARVKESNTTSNKIRKTSKNASSACLDTDKSCESSENLALTKESNNAKRRFSSRLMNNKRRREEKLEKEEKQSKRPRKATLKENRQNNHDDKKCINRRNHSRHQSSTDESEDERSEVQSYLVHPKFRLRRQSSDDKSLIPGVSIHDESNMDDELQVVPYVTDLFQHLYCDEEKYRPQMYMTRQRDINAKMRAILIDWLVEVHMKFRLAPETLYLCVNIIDRYCHKSHVMRSQLQLVGVTALLIACKYEEIYPPEVSDCVYITDRAYTRNDILEMEQRIVHKLRFHITVPTAYPFLQRFLNVVKASALIKHAATYYTERTLQEYDLNKFKPSVISAAAVILAINNPDICRRDEFQSTLVSGMPSILLEYTQFGENELRECARLIAEKVGEEPITASRRRLGAVKKKYENRRYMHVSAMRLPCLQ